MTDWLKIGRSICHDPYQEVDWEALMAEEARQFALDQAGELDTLCGPPLGYPEPPDDPPDEPTEASDDPCGDCPYIDGAPDSPPPHCHPECPARAAMQALFRENLSEPEGSVYFSIGRAPYDL